jgi:hypothetical protein
MRWLRGDFNAASNIVSQGYTDLWPRDCRKFATNYLGLPPGFAATGFHSCGTTIHLFYFCT